MLFVKRGPESHLHLETALLLAQFAKSGRTQPPIAPLHPDEPASIKARSLPGLAEAVAG